ncbi:MAG: UDP-3-O-(3-hydroxymyristoyl)glucosamine N-acyltransferase [Mangrovicoccus sp.]|nr:UDP-3-O-(3-hydroxymyristoyl)glucosamine N-acyltransferase [Mangrovicoccus sp.]
MAHKVAEIAQAIGARFEGNNDILISGAAEPGLAGADQIALAMSPKYADALREGAARVALLWPDAPWQEMGLEAAIFVEHGKLAMAGLTALMDPGPAIEPGIHPAAYVADAAELGPDCAIGPFAVVGAGAKIGARARIAAHATVAPEAQIGDDVLLHSGARVCSSARLGDRVILHPNAVIGADGFSFVTPEPSSVERVRSDLGDHNEAREQHWQRVHSLGHVEIGDDVEIGANANIDRGTIRATKIGRGTKIDNLVQIGHNVEVGADCMICSQVGLAGSAKVGDRVVLAGQVGVNDNIFIGDDVVAGGASKIFTNVPAGRVVLGAPATKMTSQLESYKALRRLPRMAKEVAALQKAVSKLTQND